MKPEPPKQDIIKPQKITLSLTLLSNLQELRRRLELAESGLTTHLHIPMGDNSVHECSLHIQKLQVCNFSLIVLIKIEVLLCYQTHFQLCQI